MPSLLLYQLFRSVGLGPLLKPLVSYLLVESQDRELRLLLNGDAADLVNLAHLATQLRAILLLISVEALVGVQIVEGRVGLLGETLLRLAVPLLSGARQLVETHLGVDPPLPHLVELCLNLVLPRLVLYLFELSLPSQPFI